MNRDRLFYRHGLPYVNVNELPGKLIVVEGTDGIGRSSQIELLTQWLQIKGHGVINTGWTQSPLLGPAIDRIKLGNTLDPTTFAILYSADFADRLENQIIPALKSGFIVLADRYMFTAFARHVVRGVESQWIRDIYGFAIIPDLVLYLNIEIEDLVMRVFGAGRSMNYWESGMDTNLASDIYQSFILYQTKVLTEFEKMISEFDFEVIDASRSVEEVNMDLRKRIEFLL